ncbi:hypothetical protein [Pseudofrankia sp. DC12]|uniref:hypothetical protein n=1 Tax=Pseudofrankia sp. DC12 TaxID=683315 RepID=UPI0006970C56|nr:hypothetical protein [Pseudofrankia sp. DC12]
MTYGWLLGEAERAAAFAAGAAPERRSLVQLEGDAAGLVALVEVAHRHAAFLARGMESQHPAQVLAGLVDGVRRRLRGLGRPVTGLAGVSLWDGAVERLAVAHDLLAAQRGPDGEPRGPDAWLLADPGALAAAAGRLAAVTGLAAAGARDLMLRSTQLAGGWYAVDDLGIVQPAVLRLLRLVAGLAGAADEVAAQRGEPARPGVLDEVGPLFSDVAASSFERRLDRLREAAHALSQPGYEPGHGLLVAFGDLAMVVCQQAGWIAWRTLARLPASQRDLLMVARAQAVAARVSWRSVLTELRDVQSLGRDGAPVIRLALDVRRQFIGLVGADDRPEAPLPAGAMTEVRRVLLVVPELAACGAATAARLLDRGLLTSRTEKGSYGPLTSHHAAALLARYAAAATASRELLARYRLLPGLQPQPHKAAYLAATPTPLATRATPVRPHPGDLAAARLAQPRWVEIRDRDHGLLRCRSLEMTAALRRTGEDLRSLLEASGGVRLTGREPLVTLAALATNYLPYDAYAALGQGSAPVDTGSPPDVEPDFGL